MINVINFYNAWEAMSEIEWKKMKTNDKIEEYAALHNIETTFNIVNKKPRYNNMHEQQNKENEIRADLYKIYKKYNDTNPRA